MRKKVRRWDEVRGENPHMTPERIAALEQKVLQELVEMDLREIRKLAEKTQTEVAKATEMAQADISRLECQKLDSRLSTLRRYVEALGGELTLVATVGDRSVRLKSAP